MSSPVVTANALSSWPSVIGTASWSRVRPILITVLNSSPLAASAMRSRSSAPISPPQGEHGGDPDRGRVDVVRRLGEVDVVVRVAALVVAARRAEQLQAAVGDHLVGVHVGGGPRTALDHVHHEVAVMVAVDDLLAGPVDRRGDHGVEKTEVAVGPGRRLLDHGEGPHEGGEVRHPHARDREVLDGAERLHPVEGVLRHVALAEHVVLAPGRAGAVGLVPPDRARARVLEATAHGQRHAAEHLDGRVAVRREAPEHAVTVERDDDEVSQCAGRGGVRGGVEQRGLSQRVSGREHSEPVGLVAVPPQDLDLALDEDVARPARGSLGVEIGAGGNLLARGCSGEQLDRVAAESGEQLAGAQELAGVVHAASSGPAVHASLIVSGPAEIVVSPRGVPLAHGAARSLGWRRRDREAGANGPPAAFAVAGGAVVKREPQ